MKVYTRTGDKGTTSLVGGTRVAKDHERLEAYGTVDELNSWLGMILAAPFADTATRTMLTWLQNKLFDLGCELATEENSSFTPKRIAPADITRIEDEIDRIEALLPLHNRFILPAGSDAAARAHVARTVARRAERRMVTLNSAATQSGATPPVHTPAMHFINRLSDYLFVLARHLNIIQGAPELFWDQDL